MTIMFIHFFDSPKEKRLIREKSDLISLYNSCHDNPQEKITLVKDLYNKCNIENEVADEIQKYTDNAFQILESLKLPKEKSEFLQNISNSLTQRKI